MSHGPWLSLPERIGRLEATIEALIRENGELRRRVENATEAEEIMRRAQASPVPPPRRPAHKRDRHGLHIVPGLAAAGAGAAAWVARSRLHKAAAVALMAVVGTASAVTPSVIGGSPAHAGQPSAVTHHRSAPAGAPSTVPPRRKRRSGGGHVSPAPSAGSGAASPAPSPAGAVQPSPIEVPPPLPSPLPSVAPLCVKLPAAACDANPRCVCPPA